MLSGGLLLPQVLSGGSLAPTLAVSSRGSGAGSLSPLQRLGCRTWRLRLRGGAQESADADPTDADDVAPRDPKAWEVEHVLAFLEHLRPKFRDRTDVYRELFTDNDIDGAVLLGLNEDKLEKARGPAPSAASVCGVEWCSCYVGGWHILREARVPLAERATAVKLS